MSVNKSQANTSLKDSDTGLQAKVEAKSTGEASLHVISEIDNIADSTSLIPSYPTSLNISQEYGISQALNDTTYYDIKIYSVPTTLVGFITKFNSTDVFIRLEIDGNEIFNINCAELKKVSDWNVNSQPSFDVSWNTNDKSFFFSPKYVIKAQSSIKIQAKSLTGTQNIDYVGSIIEVF